MNLPPLIKGIVIGFSIAAPVGPIGVLCIRRTLSEGRTAGLLSGLGAATADALYGCVAGFGMTWMARALMGQRDALRLIGGGFLLYLGAKSFATRPVEEGAAPREGGLASAYGSTFALTLANPMTILSFMGVFAGLGLGSSDGTFTSAAVLVLGVFIGSSLWWCVLSGSVGLLRGRLQAGAMRWVNRLSGIVIAAFGADQIARLIGDWR